MPKNNIEIIYQDKDLLIINKPAGISTTADRSGVPDLLPTLRKQLPGENDLRLIHRLDKSASGVMLMAKNRETQSKFSSLFERRTIKKTYLALAVGPVHGRSGTIDTPLSHSRKNPQLMRIDPKRGKPALTHWQLLADFGTVALLSVQPITGRTHQIRVHLKSIQLPLAIDPFYGSTRPIMLSDFKTGYRFKKNKSETPLIDRLTLHAYQIEIPQTDTNPAIYVAGLDKKFAATIKALTKHNPNGIEAFLNQDHLAAILSAEALRPS